MKNLNLLIKPASSSCNLRCRYCFYYDVADNREVKNYGIMNDDTLENMVKKVFDDVEYSANFAFQGGEPTMAGIEFFEKFHKFVEKYNTKKIIVNFSLQTNGTLLNKKWLELFKKHNYLIGLSLDGNKEMHDTFRIDAKGEGTFSRVLKAAKMMKKAEVEFNILCVVNKLIAQNGKLVYNFFRNNGFRYYQFIPCLDSLSCSEEKDYTLTAEDYGKFLDETFNLWYEDMMSGKRISVRHFDNYTKILLGEEPEACDMVGHCNMNAVLESDGSMYPCDFYVLDEFKVGNINESSFEELFKSEAEMRFLRTSLAVDEKCKVCRYFKICRGGCRRHKELTAEGNYENRFCESYKYFFERNIDKMIKTAEYVMKIRRENFIKNK
ncbi:MAG: anaerobic sulfatase maturase [Fusobacterium sp.]|nr:anaerobic sulfatase maturase [Fusobacterium sp.]